MHYEFNLVSLRSQREAADLSLRALAVRSGFSASYLSRVETGRRPATAAVVHARRSPRPAVVRRCRASWRAR
jgi:predicted transcriptional regulator